MPQINILNILQGDNQSNIVDKINYNFDQILSAGGGPQGQQGLIGPTGPIGPQGPQGPQGLQGPSGTKWFVQDSSPASGGVTGSNPWTYPTIGDYWLDPDSADQDIYVFTATGWTYTGYGLAAGQLFQKISPVNFNGGLTGQAILIAGTASPQTVVFSDSNINGITGYVPSGTAIDNINYENSKLKISTRNDRTKIISFSHSEFDVINTSGTSGSTGNYNWNPSIDWDASSPISSAFYDISFQNPTGTITISSLGTINGGVNLFANKEISAQSSTENIILKTSSTNKGTFIDASNVGGFLELSNNSPTPINQSYAPLFANSTGLGLGLGTGQFKQTGTDSRRLAVLGNATISKNEPYHSQNVFTYNDVGTLNVEGIVGIGPFTTPTGSPLGVSTTGPAESLGYFPLLYVTSNQYGPVSQFKHAVTKGRTARTVIGGGSYDFAAGNLVAGNASDIFQESYYGGGPLGKGYTAGPLISYQHKITSNANTTAGGPVFALTTYNTAGTYNPNTIAEKTVIQTLNSNNKLLLQANATTLGRVNQNIVSLGTNTYNKISVWGGINSDEYGTVSIGPLSDTFAGTRSFLSLDSNISTLTPFSGKGDYYPNYQTSDHSLYVSGYQTIGAPDTISMFKNVNGISADGYGYYSKLKIHRNLGTGTFNFGGENLISGDYPGSYSNGLEITSLVSTQGTSKGQRSSFALGIGAVNRIDNYNLPLNQRTYADPTGFFVSDTGERASVGYDISTGNLNTGAALSVSGPAPGNTAIDALGYVNVTGNTNIDGVLSVTGPGPGLGPAMRVTIPFQGPSAVLAAQIGMDTGTSVIFSPNTIISGFNNNTVSGDLFMGSANGSSYAPMTIGAKDGGGLRFYRTPSFTPVVSTNSILRADLDITTGTDTPGWEYHSYISTDFIGQNMSSGAWNYGYLNYVGDTLLFDRPHLSYKIIGKTVFMKCSIRLSGSNPSPWGVNTRGLLLILPNALQPLIKNYYNIPVGNVIGAASSDGIGWTDAPYSTGISIIRISIRKYNNTPFANSWVFNIESALNNGYPFPQSPPGQDVWFARYIRFETTAELI